MPVHGSDKLGEIHTYRIYPLTIIIDRYSGTYSGGEFTVWNLYPETVPDAIYSNDSTCLDFWNELNHDEKSYNYQKYHDKYGVGNTIQEAIDNLQNNLSHLYKMIEIEKDVWEMEGFIK